MNNLTKNLLMVIILLLFAGQGFAYEGYTPITTGGSGGNTIWVTNLNDSGSGSFRDAIASTTTGSNIIKFSTSGTINLTSGVSLTNPYVTIDGSSSPNGITLNGSGITGLEAIFSLNTHDIIVKHMRFRNSPKEGIQVTGDYNIIVDHCSITGSEDGALDINGGTHHLIASYCLFADNVEVHRSYGKNTSLHHNLYTYNNRRQPKIYKAGPCYDFRNNVVEYWTNTGTNVQLSTAGVNIIDNYYGPPAPGETWGAGFLTDSSSNWYTNGNYNPGENVDALGDRETPVPEPNVLWTQQDADANLLSYVRGNCGAMPRDACDTSWAGTSSGYLQADAGSNQTEVVDVNVTFDGSGSTGNIVSYSWDYGDDSADGNGVSPSHSYDDVNEYTVTLTVTDDTNSTDEDTCVITIVDPNALTADAGSDQDVDVGDTVNFDGSGSTGNITLYEWDFDDGDSNTGETTNHVYDTAGQYTVTLTVTDDANETDEDTCIVTVDPNITITYAAGDANGWGFDEDGVVLQTIYGTDQDANGTITGNSYRYVSIDKGLALAFGLGSETVLESMTFKCRGIKNSNTLRFRMFDVTGDGYLDYGNSMPRTQPGDPGAEIFDIESTTSGSVPSHDEGGIAVTDMTINFDALQLDAGQYLLCFDAQGPSNTWGNFIRGATEAESLDMGEYADGNDLPNRATVTTSSATGNNYFYQLNSTSATDYSAYSLQYAFQMLERVDCNGAPVAASAPTPADSATNIDPNGDLSWTAGDCSDTHDVYFGTGYNDVLNADHNSTEYKGNQVGTSYEPGSLAYNTTYYWAIDEVNNDGTTAGSVWSFTTAIAPPAPATSPSPADDATDVNTVTTDLSWTAGAGATSHDVYFGTSSPGAFQGNQGGTTYDIGTTDANTVYYWRIDERNTGGVTEGSVWSFTTWVPAAPGQASSPSPADDATDVNTTPILSWTAGSGATSHDVYFGTSSPGTFQGNQGGVTFDPGTLSPDTIYYWRIDEKNAGGTTTGSVWDFETAEVNEPNSTIKLAYGTVSDVNDNWQTVNLSETYTSMVVVATPNYDGSSKPVVTRIKDASGSSFDLRCDTTDGTTEAGVTVHYMVVEEGVYTDANDGVKMEATKVTSDQTNYRGGWYVSRTESHTYQNSYTKPAVVGQVMTYNDPNWVVFWSCRGASYNPISDSICNVGKHIGQDQIKAHGDETLGYIIIESGSGSIDDVNYVADLGADTVKGPDDAPPYIYSLSDIDPSVAVCSQSGMDGIDGSWTVLYGSTPLSSTELKLISDEDQAYDAERAHYTEQVCYIVLEE